MNNSKLINCLEKYKGIAEILEKQEDAECLEEMICILKEKSIPSEKSNKMSRETEKKRFERLVTGEELRKNVKNEEILKNEKNMFEYWNKLSQEEKEKFSVYELNVIRYLISKIHCEYTKIKKQDLIIQINSLIKELKKASKKVVV